MNKFHYYLFTLSIIVQLPSVGAWGTVCELEQPNSDSKTGIFCCDRSATPNDKSCQPKNEDCEKGKVKNGRRYQCDLGADQVLQSIPSNAVALCDEVKHIGTASSLSCPSDHFKSHPKNQKSWIVESENRPPELQAAIDEEFRKLSQMEGKKRWHINSTVTYPLMGLDLPQVGRWLVDHAEKEKEIRILDYGSGDFSWTLNAAKILGGSLKKDGVKIHVYGVTGENQYPPDEIKKIKSQHDAENVEVHLLQQVPLENIKQMFKDEKFNLIVSNWTINHLVDPLGDVKQLYDLLHSKSGVMMFDDFDTGNKKLQLEMLLAESNVPYLLGGQTARSMGRAGVMIERNRNKALDFSVDYDSTRPLMERSEHGREIGRHAADTYARYKPHDLQSTQPVMTHLFRPEIMDTENISFYKGNRDLFERFLPYLEKSSIAIEARKNAIIAEERPVSAGPAIKYTTSDKEIK
jgi:SAM-dependent methyltransferase